MLFPDVNAPIIENKIFTITTGITTLAGVAWGIHRGKGFGGILLFGLLGAGVGVVLSAVITNISNADQ